jgi:hypothetical protein
MTTSALKRITEVDTSSAFEAGIAEGSTPVVLRGAARDWSCVRAATAGRDTLLAWLRDRDRGQAVYAILGRPEIEGRFGFDSDTRQVNYAARQSPLSSVLDRLGDAEAGGFAIAIQAAPAREVLHHWDEENPNPWLPPAAEPTFWISMASRVAPHSDVHDNVAVVVGGRRRFTLFPPEQIANLYLGPLLASPGGVPTSSVNIWNPDLEKHPRYATAAKSATVSTLHPGDAIYIPALWWHAVESLEALNMLVNFWFGEEKQLPVSLPDTLTHAILAFSALPEHKRQRWQQYFRHLVFRLDDDPAKHLPEDLEDLLTGLGSEKEAALLDSIGKRMLSANR